ncbi:Nonspecific acid phosphatase [uncultured delta proteobacterium]|uniref:phosphoserine phosphatase n=1 Tax=uncultured delta proteobacterium TaxID=34034 RepID=A0A212JU67_9DELT|nr:Nonspecific acid phosphatase [uncultured delta proteobacterium]
MVKRLCILFFFVFAAVIPANAAGVAEPAAMPSWNDTAAKEAILAFVRGATTPGSADFVPPSERIAVFDNDGTLWAEQPMYAQVFFMVDRIRDLAPGHPEWRKQEPFASVLQGDLKSALSGGDKAVFALGMAAHAGMSTDEFERITADWLAKARNPATGRLFTNMVYQPMLELMDYLRAHAFKVYIVSGGGVDLMRGFSERVYGVPPENVIGSSLKTKWDDSTGTPRIMRLPEVDFIDDREGKPLAIQRVIGRRPLMAFGNSDGDLQMLQWTTAGPGKRFALIVHHTDAAREWAYDRESPVGKLDKALDEANRKGWIVLDMRKDWKIIYKED